MIEPTVGRIVHVRRRVRHEGPPEAAIITSVLTPNRINVAGWDAGGSPFTAQGIHLKQDDADLDKWMNGYSGPYAEWMAYQKGQAARTEQLERQVGAGGKDAGRRRGE